MVTMTIEEATAYTRDGYLVRKDFLSKEIVSLYADRVRAPITNDISSGVVVSKKDIEGRTALVRGLAKADEELYGFIGRDKRLVDLAQDAIGAPVYRYGHEITLKQPDEIGDGAWDWHQDFGFFYSDGLLAPQLAAIWLPLDKATSESGCFRVLKGSHKLGRLNHNTDLNFDNQANIREKKQTHVEREALEAAMELFEIVDVELDIGDVMIFDGNLIHGSGRNQSERQLWSYVCYYSAVGNVHYRQSHQFGDYEPLESITLEAVLKSAS